jgi:hypothetical protein
MVMSKITFTVSLESEEDAQALAQFVKRVSFTTCERHAIPGDVAEAFAMLRGLEAVRLGMGEKGYNPR